jgi:hypothetical protein
MMDRAAVDVVDAGSSSQRCRSVSSPVGVAASVDVEGQKWGI